LSDGDWRDGKMAKVTARREEERGGDDDGGLEGYYRM